MMDICIFLSEQPRSGLSHESASDNCDVACDASLQFQIYIKEYQKKLKKTKKMAPNNRRHLIVLRKPRDSRVVPLSLSDVFSFYTPNVYNQMRDLPVTQKKIHIRRTVHCLDKILMHKVQHIQNGTANTMWCLHRSIEEKYSSTKKELISETS